MTELGLTWPQAMWEFPVDVCCEIQVAYAEKQRGKRIERDLEARESMMRALEASEMRNKE